MSISQNTSLFKDELTNSKIYTSIINSNETKSELITIKIRIRQYSIKQTLTNTSNSNSNQKNKDKKENSYSKIRISLVAFMNFPIFKNEILLQQGNYNKEINKVYLINEKDNEQVSFESSEEWEEYFQVNYSFINKGNLKFEYSLKSTNRIEIEKSIQSKGHEFILEFIDYMRNILVSNDDAKHKLNKFLYEKKIIIPDTEKQVFSSVGFSNVNTSGNEEFNLIVYDVLFKTLKSNAFYYKKISGLLDNNTTCGSSSDINQSQIPDFEEFFDEKDKENSN